MGVQGSLLLRVRLSIKPETVLCGHCPHSALGLRNTVAGEGPGQTASAGTGLQWWAHGHGEEDRRGHRPRRIHSSAELSRLDEKHLPRKAAWMRPPTHTHPHAHAHMGVQAAPPWRLLVPGLDPCKAENTLQGKDTVPVVPHPVLASAPSPCAVPVSPGDEHLKGEVMTRPRVFGPQRRGGVTSPSQVRAAGRSLIRA